MERLTRSQIVTALGRLDDRLGDVEKKAHVYLVDGAVMCLVHEVRSSTKDVDAWFTEPVYIRKAVKEVAEELGLPEDWLNDAARGSYPGTPVSRHGSRSPTSISRSPTTGLSLP